MAPTNSLVVKKTLPYLGGTQVWSNRYHFTGGTPADAAHWHTFMDAVVADEAAALTDNDEIIECVGYVAGSDISVAEKTFSTMGTLAGGSNAYAPGDVCALLRYSTAARTTKNHPVYLFNYFHGPIVTAGGNGAITGAQVTALEEYGDDWLAGFSDGTNTYVRAGPNGANATARFVHPYATHRDFPR